MVRKEMVKREISNWLGWPEEEDCCLICDAMGLRGSSMVGIGVY
jgi:hypothetical protein